MAAYFAAAPTRVRIIRRQRRNALEDMPEDFVISEYRLNHSLIAELCRMVTPKLKRKTRRSNALSVEEQVLLCLKLMASGSFQNCAKDYLNVAQPTVSVVFDAFLDALGENAPDYIHMPSDPVSTMENFSQIAGFPGVIGAIDGTHIPIIAPTANEHLYVGRKGFHSINVQAVCDDELMFTDVEARWPDATHDAFVLQHSQLLRRFESGEFRRGILLGDSGYPLKKWLMTPYSRATSPDQIAFNKAHKSTRTVIERAFGILKQRWRIIDHTGGYLCYSPLKTCKIFVCCAILHNMCRRQRLPLTGTCATVPRPLNDDDAEVSGVRDARAVTLRDAIASNITNAYPEGRFSAV